jgi:hypothetical protein
MASEIRGSPGGDVDRCFLGCEHPEDEGDKFLFNADNHLQEHTALQLRRPRLTELCRAQLT